MKNKQLIFGIILTIDGIVNAFLNIPSTWHYFVNGAIFGIGVLLIIFHFKKK